MNTAPLHRILLPPPRPRTPWRQAFLPTWVALRHASQLVAFGRAQTLARRPTSALRRPMGRGDAGWSCASHLASAA